MKICIKIIGDAIELLLKKTLGHGNVNATCDPTGEKIDWELESIPRGFVASDWVCQENHPTILVIDGDDPALLRTLESSQNNLLHLINTGRTPQVIRCPIILIFKYATSLGHWAQLPEFTTDWMLAANMRDEFVLRILGAYRKAQIPPISSNHAALTLVPANRTMIYENTSARLTPAEFTLLELFLYNIGSIISLQELVQTFRSSGKSAEANNIRVAIYQLRLKLDALTKSQMPLTSIYRQGYCLRQKSKGKPMQIPISVVGHRCGTQNSA